MKKFAYILGIVLAMILLYSVVMVFTPGYWGGPIRIEIDQQVGGQLIAAGEDWMDIQSFGDITKVSFIGSDEEAPVVVGDSDYYGRTFDQKKQIVFRDGAYYLIAGDRLEGDKVFVSKELKGWKEFKFKRASLSAFLEEDERYLENFFPDEVLVVDEAQGIAEWTYRIEGALEPQSMRFCFRIDWKAEDLIIELIEPKIGSWEGLSTRQGASL